MYVHDGISHRRCAVWYMFRRSLWLLHIFIHSFISWYKWLVNASIFTVGSTTDAVMFGVCSREVSDCCTVPLLIVSFLASTCITTSTVFTKLSSEYNTMSLSFSSYISNILKRECLLFYIYIYIFVVVVVVACHLSVFVCLPFVFVSLVGQFLWKWLFLDILYTSLDPAMSADC